MNWTDIWVTALALLAAFAPGTVLLRFGLGAGRLHSLAVAPAVSVAVCYLTALVAGVLGFAWGSIPVAIATVLLTALGWSARRRWARPPVVPVERTSLAATLRTSLLPISGLVVSALIGAWTLLRGFGHLTVLPQEHDMVLQTLVVARIERTGQAAPWQSSPIDLLSGSPEGFYPNGVHMLASLAATSPGMTVAALNAMTVVLFAVALPLGMCALGRLLVPARIRAVTMTAAPLISVLAYRPLYAFLHDGGVLANAAALTLVPGVVYAAVAAATRPAVSSLAGAALGLTGAVVVHPSAGPSIAITAGTWIATGLLRDAGGLRATLRRLVWLVLAGVASVLLLVPFLLTASSTAGFVAGFPRAVPPTSLGGALGTTMSFYYGGYFDPSGLTSQVVFAGLSALGVLLCVYFRSNLPLLASYAVWLAILLVWLVRPDFPLISQLGAFYYNNFGRMSGGFAQLQWLTAAAACGYLALLLGNGIHRLATGRGWSRITAHQGAVVHGAAVLALGVLLLASISYAGVNRLTVAQRYGQPQFVRVDANDLAAGRYLAEHVGPGERVMNNANDGSTYTYIYDDVPLVETSTLGSPYASYTTELLLHFDDVATNPEVRRVVCQKKIAWVLADSQAPVIGAPESVTPLSDHGVYSTPPGFRDLDSAPDIHRAFRQGTVSVYHVDLGRLGC